MVYVLFLVLLVLIFAGYILKRTIIKSETFWHRINNLLYYILLPILFIGEISKSNLENIAYGNLIIIVLLALSIMTLLLFGIKKMFRIEGAKFTSVFQGVIRYNSYILIGVYTVIMPQNGILLFSILSIFLLIFTNTLSVMVLELYCSKNKPSLLSFILGNFKNPLILSILIGLLFRLFHIEFPEKVNQELIPLAKVTIVLSLLIIGAGLRIEDLRKNKLLLIGTSFLKLILLPIIAIILLQFFDVDKTIKTAIIIFCTSPCAFNSYILSKQMNGDAELMASIILVVTFASIITMPIFITLAL
ncbi:AEC family transporter [Aureivirga sp. CE67]|uniref:AEC family transporter n=1 Tax=Aureivirga sp. CE67 TaxID=1788983 RepID=UPI0018CADDF5|nr:AEC family transporter [Aureivirga sp. CE67]